MAPIRTTADALIGKIIFAALLLYVGGNGLALLLRAFSLFTLML